MISVIAKVPVKEEAIDDAIEAFKTLIVEVAKEEGTLAYTLNRDKSDPNLLVVMERYKDQDALTAHSATQAFKEFSTKIPGFLSGAPEISVMDEIVSI